MVKVNTSHREKIRKRNRMLIAVGICGLVIVQLVSICSSL